MKKQKNHDLINEMNQLTEELKNTGPLMRGSVTFMGKKNKQPYFSVGMQGRTKVMYLGNKRAKLAQKYSANYKRLLEIIDEMTIINMNLLKSMETK